MKVQHLQEQLSEELGVVVRSLRVLGGGDINDAYEALLDSGGSVFVKTNPDGPDGMFPVEAKGLEWLRETESLRVPQVIGLSNGHEGKGGYLVLEMLKSAPRQADFDVRLGRGLAALHRCGAPSFGLEHSNFIGSLAQSNEGSTLWHEFYAHQRLAPLVASARRMGCFSHRQSSDFEKLYVRLPILTGPEEAPARLHGDLWSGNLHVGPNGEPCLIDPAVYGGHREMDLAMMRLFGGFSERCFDAYNEVFPLAPGAKQRVELYQLYPLLVHVNLFGGSYVSSALATLKRYL